MCQRALPSLQPALPSCLPAWLHALALRTNTHARRPKPARSRLCTSVSMEDLGSNPLRRPPHYPRLCGAALLAAHLGSLAGPVLPHAATNTNTTRDAAPRLDPALGSNNVPSRPWCGLAPPAGCTARKNTPHPPPHTRRAFTFVLYLATGQTHAQRPTELPNARVSRAPPPAYSSACRADCRGIPSHPWPFHTATWFAGTRPVSVTYRFNFSATPGLLHLKPTAPAVTRSQVGMALHFC